MFADVIDRICDAAIGKVNFINKSRGRYIISSVLAGMFVGFGIILIFSIGGLLSSVNSPATRIVMGASFGIALSLVVMCGSELFTGNNAVMTIATLNKKVTWTSTFRIWVYSFIGNLLGSVVLAYLYSNTGLFSGPIGEFIVKTSAAKMSILPFQLIVRGILCNILVCLATWCYFKLQSETAKLIMVFWCLFAFITSGFEHSVANMTLLSIALFIPHSSTVNWGGYIYNISMVTLGNMIGGIVFVALAYWYIYSERN